MYCYWDFIEEKKSSGPLFSDHSHGASSFLHPISDGEKQCPFGIVEIDFGDFQELKQYPYIEEVPNQVYRVLKSSISYPPALILAREDIDRLDLTEKITKEEFSDIVVDLLHKYLERQWVDNFFLAEVKVAKSDETYVGEFLWMLGYTPKIKLVHFAGWDYFRDVDHVSCFELTTKQIESLPIVEMERYTLFDPKNKRMADIDLSDETLDFEEISELIRVTR